MEIDEDKIDDAYRVSLRRNLGDYHMRPIPGESEDARLDELRSLIERMGAEGSAAPTPDCAALARLRDRMEALVTAQREKWAYLIAKVDRELAR